MDLASFVQSYVSECGCATTITVLVAIALPLLILFQKGKNKQKVRKKKGASNLTKQASDNRTQFEN